MTEKTVMDALVLMKRTGNLLNDLEDLTRQLAECLDRNDQVSARMLVAMRQDPIRQLAEVDSSEKARLNALTEEDRNRAEALRRGEQSPGEDGERIFLEQAGKTRRLLEQVVELDRRTSVRMAGEQSFYHK